MASDVAEPWPPKEACRIQFGKLHGWIRIEPGSGRYMAASGGQKDALGVDPKKDTRILQKLGSKRVNQWVGVDPAPDDDMTTNVRLAIGFAKIRCPSVSLAAHPPPPPADALSELLDVVEHPVPPGNSFILGWKPIPVDVSSKSDDAEYLQQLLPVDGLTIPSEYMKISPASSFDMVYIESDGNKQCWIEEGFMGPGDGGEVDGGKVFGVLCKLCSMPRWANMRWHSSTLAAVPKSSNWRYKSCELHVRSTLHERALNAIGKQHQQLVPLADSILKYGEVKSGPIPPPPDASANAAMTRVRLFVSTLAANGTVTDYGQKMLEHAAASPGSVGNIEGNQASFQYMAGKIQDAVDTVLKRTVLEELETADEVCISADEPRAVARCGVRCTYLFTVRISPVKTKLKLNAVS